MSQLLWRHAQTLGIDSLRICCLESVSEEQHLAGGGSLLKQLLVYGLDLIKLLDLSLLIWLREN